MHDADIWLAKLARLRIDTASGAPHKPLLLLVVFDLAQQGTLLPTASAQPQSGGAGDLLALTPQLAFRFCSYWQIVAHRRKQKPDVRWPFTKLQRICSAPLKGTAHRSVNRSSLLRSYDKCAPKNR